MLMQVIDIFEEDNEDPEKGKKKTSKQYLVTHFLGPASVQDGVDANTGIFIMTAGRNKLRYARLPIEILENAMPMGKYKSETRALIDRLLAASKTSEPDTPSL
jgi:hypothetical protein